MEILWAVLVLLGIGLLLFNIYDKKLVLEL